ncbi:hypothetical protein BpHYR1_041672 [Brachionus plicatilis]|uniref:RNA-directed DNA polymerase from mobile element jockey-like n=1 Tax=Brachionus plicatilis TaxID=10195 RepID=A0A3M7ST50_BRAPC|nr:hypothetical protein BpHYR1_041672 [Brachionus plicatilis]
MFVYLNQEEQPGLLVLDVKPNKGSIHEARKRAALGALPRLKNLEIFTENTCPFLKRHLYKTYILPVLMYGMETICLTKTNKKEVTRLENNLLKYVYYVPKRCRTTNLRLINNVKKTHIRLKQMHIEFFERLLENEFTKSIIKELLNVENDKDYVSNTLDLLNEIEYESSMDLIDKCKY